MFRSVAVALLFLILPGLAPAQEVAQSQQTTHEVVPGETLWSLAGRYLGNPYRWPLIYQANTSQIQNPDLLMPGQVLVIPGIGREAAQVQGVVVITKEAGVVTEEDVVVQPVEAPVRATGTADLPCPGPGDQTVFSPGGGQARRCPVSGPPLGERTSFYASPAENRIPGEMGTESAPAPSAGRSGLAAVPLGRVYASEWLVNPGEDVGFIGTLSGFSRVHADRAPVGPARVRESVTVAESEGTHLKVGDLLQSFRTVREKRGMGSVQRPTGILVVTEVSESGVVAMVSWEMDRIRVGDMVRTPPDYSPRPNGLPVPVESNVVATILGFPEERQAQPVGAAAFLDVGEAEGISVGDIFQASVDDPGPFFGTELATLQVVLVEGDHSTARVIDLSHPTLVPGARVHLIEKVR